MSRNLEIDTNDAVEVVAKRAYTAFRRVGRVADFDPDRGTVEGKVYVGGYPAYVVVEWKPAKDADRTRVDISATSGDELSRAADRALYLFARSFKAVQEKDFVSPEDVRRRGLLLWSLAGILALLLIVVAAAMQMPRFGS